MTRHLTFVAEIGSNHNGDFARACELIDVAASIGCDAVKFQLYRLETLYVPELWASKASMRKTELPLEWLDPLATRARKNGLQVGCTPCAPDLVDVLASWDFLKVSSYSLLHGDLLDAVSRMGKPVVLGCGMATFTELWWALEHFRPFSVTLLHCRSAYPTPLNECGLAILRDMSTVFSAQVGWSDHTAAPAAIFAAVGCGASMVECHLDLEGDGAEFDGDHCWLPGPLADTIVTARQIATAMEGRVGKKAIAPAPCEGPERNWRADPKDGLRPRLVLRTKEAQPA